MKSLSDAASGDSDLERVESGKTGSEPHDVDDDHSEQFPLVQDVDSGLGSSRDRLDDEDMEARDRAFGLKAGWWRDPGLDCEIAASLRPKKGTGAVHLGATSLPKGPVLSDPNLSQLLASSFVGASQSDNLLLPWEKGFCKELFNPGSASSQTLGSRLDWVKLSDSAGQSNDADGICDFQESQPMLTGAMYERVLMGISDKTFQQQLQDKIDLAVSRWHCIISHCLLISTTGRQVASLGDDSSAGSEAQRVIRAVIGTKSASTALARSSSLLRFLNWSAFHHSEVDIPFTEELAWQ